MEKGMNDKEKKVKEEKEKSLNELIIKIRVDLQNSKIRKSGKNKFAGFEYYELADFLPKLNELMLEAGINDRFTIDDNTARLELIKGVEKQEYTIPFKVFPTPLNKNGTPSMQDIQYLGALNTYYKRYLYLNAFGITDGEVIDSMDNTSLKKGMTIKANGNTEKEITDLLVKMKQLAIDTNTDIEELLKYYGVETNADMTLEQLQDCVSKLEIKEKKLEMLRESGQE
jgi:hypothetical protein